jgi:hypothetical protein
MLRQMLDKVPWGHSRRQPEPLYVPPGYRVEELSERVPGGDTARGYRLRWLAQRECDRMNRLREMPSYRWEVVDTAVRWPRARYWPCAFQNQLVRVEPRVKA